MTLPRAAKGLAVAVAALVAALVTCEAVLRAIDGYALASVSLTPARGRRQVSTLEMRRADLRYVDGIARARGVDRAWYADDPAPIAAVPLDAERESRARRYPSDPIGAFSYWNRNYLQRELCAGVTRGSLGLLDDFFAFDPIEPTPYPSYIHPAHFTFPGYVTTNGLGWRGPDVPAQRSASAIRIAFVGASTTISDALFSYPEYVGVWLNRWARATGRPYTFEIINAGESGIDSSSIAAIVRQQVVPIAPDLVVYYEGANDFQPAATIRLTRRMPPRPNITFVPPSTLERHSDTVRRAVTVWRSYEGGDGSEPRKPAFDLVWPDGRSETDPDVTQSPLPMDLHHVVDNLESMRTALQSSGAELALSSFVWMVYPGMRLSFPEHLTLHRYLNETYWPVSYAHMRRMADYQNRVFEAFAKRYGLVYLDLAKMLPRDPDLFGDAVHMTPDGLRLQAWLYVQQLVPLVETRVAEGRWPRPAAAQPPVDRLRSHVTLVSRREVMSHCHD